MENKKIVVNADAGVPRPRVRPIWRYVGYDEPNYTYTDAGRELLGKLSGMAGAPFYARCHFLFCSGDGTPSLKWGSTNVCTLDDTGAFAYDWTILDRIFDTYVELGIIPFVELGFTPEALTSAPEGTEYASARLGSGWSYPPNDLAAWGDLVGSVADHYVARYGLAEVVRWRWELWNEPDIPYFTGTAEEYCELYDYTEAAIHDRYPMLLVGGPSTTNPGSEKAARFLTSFLDHCSAGMNAITGATGTRLDFITFHAKGAHLTREPDAPKQTPTISTLTGHVQEGLDIVARYPEFADLEIVVSECDPDGWAAGTRYDNPNLEYRNSEYYASYFAASIVSLLHLHGGPARDVPRPRVDGALTWAFEFEGREYFEGMRSLSTNGVDKPVLNAFRLFELLGPLDLATGAADPRTGVRIDTGDASHHLCILPTAWENGRVAVMIASHHDDWDVTGTVPVTVEINGLAGTGDHRATRWTVDTAHGNAFTEWVRMGRPPFPAANQVRQLTAASAIHPEPMEIEALNTGVRLQVEIELRSVTVIEIAARSPAADRT
jgi:xylan 1,4-beta-xylosidase